MSYSCAKVDDIRLVDVEKIIDEEPTAAYQKLQKINLTELDGDGKALYGLLMTKAMYKNYIPILSDSLINLALNKFKSGSRCIQSLIFKGVALQEMGQTLEAIEWYKRAESATSLTDYETLGYINMRLGNLYTNVYVTNDSIKFDKYHKALIYYTKANNNKYIQACLASLGSLATGQDMKQAKYYLDKAINIALERKDKIGYLNYMEILARGYVVNGDYEQSKQTALKILNFDENIIPSSVFYDLSVSYSMLGMVDSARYYYKRMSKPSTQKEKVENLDALKKLNYACGDYRQAFLTADECRLLSDSITKKEDRLLLYEFEKRNDKQKAELDKAKAQRQNVLLILGLLFVIAVFAVTIILLRSRYILRRRQAEALLYDCHSQKNRALQQLVDSQIVSAELKKTLAHELEIIRSIVKLSYDYSNRPEVFLKKFNGLLKNDTVDEVAFWKDIFTVADLLFNNTLSKIIKLYPFLKEHELRFICLLLCGFSITEMSVCLNFSNVYSINNKKRILSKKMNLEDLSLDEYLENLKMENS